MGARATAALTPLDYVLRSRLAPVAEALFWSACGLDPRVEEWMVGITAPAQPWFAIAVCEKVVKETAPSDPSQPTTAEDEPRG